MLVNRSKGRVIFGISYEDMATILNLTDRFLSLGVW
jgi:hypothetical protein